MANLETLTLKELREMAKEKGVKGWWNMKKVELVEVLGNEVESVEAISNDEPVEVEQVEVEPEIVQEETPEEPKVEPVKKNQKRLIEYNGKTQTLTAWAKELGIRHQTLYNRIVIKGWEIDKAFEAPTKKEVTVSAEGNAKA